MLSGIDVQAELNLKTGSHALGPGFMPPGAAVSQPQMQPTVLQKQQSRRSGVHNFLPKLAPGQSNPDMGSVTSPRNQLTPSSHASSPTQLSTRSPMAMSQSGLTSPTSAVQPSKQFQSFARTSQPQLTSQGSFQSQQAPHNMRMQPQRPSQRIQYHARTSSLSSHSPSTQHSGGQPMVGTSVDSAGIPNASASAFYPSPFQKHFDQLGKSTPLTANRTVFVLG